MLTRGSTASIAPARHGRRQQQGGGQVSARVGSTAASAAAASDVPPGSGASACPAAKAGQALTGRDGLPCQQASPGRRLVLPPRRSERGGPRLGDTAAGFPPVPVEPVSILVVPGLAQQPDTPSDSWLRGGERDQDGPAVSGPGWPGRSSRRSASAHFIPPRADPVARIGPVNEELAAVLSFKPLHEALEDAQ